MKRWTLTGVLAPAAAVLCVILLNGCQKTTSLIVQPSGQIFVYAEKGDIIKWTNSTAKFHFGISPCKVQNQAEYSECEVVKLDRFQYRCKGCIDAGIVGGKSGNPGTTGVGALATSSFDVLDTASPGLGCISGSAQLDPIESKITKSAMDDGNASLIEVVYQGEAPPAYKVKFEDGLCFEQSDTVCRVSKSAEKRYYGYKVTINAGECNTKTVDGKVLVHD